MTFVEELTELSNLVRQSPPEAERPVGADEQSSKEPISLITPSKPTAEVSQPQEDPEVQILEPLAVAPLASAGPATLPVQADKGKRKILIKRKKYEIRKAFDIINSDQANLPQCSLMWTTNLLCIRHFPYNFSLSDISSDKLVLVTICSNINKIFPTVINALEVINAEVQGYLRQMIEEILRTSLVHLMLPVESVSMASLTELSFNWLGFISAMISNISFTYRSIYSKKAMTDMDSTNLYAYISIIALIVCIPPALILEGPQLLKHGFNDAIAKVGLTKFVTDLFWVGMFYHLYNQLATNTLERVAPLTHAVGNVLKRVFVIGFSILVFGNKISLQTGIGTSIAIAGVAMYSFIKAKIEEEKRQAKAA
ncbi:hypothetical protein ACJIZ3_006328 [Penstemon smallii]|uniref:Sugar phosphate transporter domain-containing protein n=1 Tax=Penstemon smallii TaxID=265156 RepID=A0ABD3S7U2_9LAMI